MRSLRRLLIGIASAAAWPLYLALAALATFLGPWPRDLAWPVSVLLLGLAGAFCLVNGGRMAFRKGGWAEEVLAAPREVSRQLRRVVLTVAIAGFVLLMPDLLLSEGLIAPSGRPISASALGRMLVLGFELTCWILAYRLLRHDSPLLEWLAAREATRIGWAVRQRRTLALTVLTALAMVLVLDASGYRFTSKRLMINGVGTLAVLGLCMAAYRLLARLIDHHAWRWKKTGEEQGGAPTAAPEAGATTAVVDDAGPKLRTLARIVVAVLGVFGWSYLCNVDIDLFLYIGRSSIPGLTDKTVTVADVFKMVVVLTVTVGVWRYLNTFFTIAIFPRMPDDPGIRFAVVTLCRYLVLAIGALAGLSSVHLGLEKIGVVLAALGVGLGFGLQEIVSNFVSGIILLLERPIRVGDIVTVATMTGKVDRINIRATTIINGDNQSMIIPNREFITGNLVNWTHKDKIIRLNLRVNVALGTDADRVTDLLLTIVRDDGDVLSNPVPNAMLDAIGDAALSFVIYAFVPDPSLLGRVRHRLYGEIQRRFEAAGIIIPLPMRELRVHSMDQPPEHEQHPSIKPRHHRVEAVHATPPPPTFVSRVPLPVPAENCHRGVDE